MTLFLIGGVAVGLLLALQGKNGTNVILDNTTNDKKDPIIPNNNSKKKTVVNDAVKKIEPPPATNYYYAKGYVILYKSFSVNHVATALSSSNEAIYEGAGDLAIVQDGIFLGVSAGDRRNNMIKLHTNLQGKTYAFWVDSSKLTATGKYDATKMKSAYTIAQIIKNYN